MPQAGDSNASREGNRGIIVLNAAFDQKVNGYKYPVCCLSNLAPSLFLSKFLT
jgi:hypothetical protein